MKHPLAGGAIAAGARLRGTYMNEAVSNERMESGKEIKVKIPVGYHIKLHTLKVLKGQSISDTVEIALEKYFQSHSYPELQTVSGIRIRV
jgi:hypothetical protein